MATLDGAKRPLAIGDGLNTDIKGANGMGLDALFIADGIHGEDVAEFTGRHMAELFAERGRTRPGGDAGACVVGASENRNGRRHRILR